LSAFVIDASVAVGIVSPDERNEMISSLLDRVIDHGAFAPSLWLLETANALRFKWAKPEGAASLAREAVEKLHALPIELVDIEPAVVRGGVLTLAYRHRLTIYDASYLHLAMILSLPLATFDRNLAKAASKEAVDVLAA